MSNVGGASSSNCAACRTYFAILSPDAVGVIAEFLLLRCRTQRERKTLPKLLLREGSPLPNVLNKVFSTLTLELSSVVCWPSSVELASETAGVRVRLNLFQDQDCHRTILRELLPAVKRLRIRPGNFIDGRFVHSSSRDMAQRCVNLKALDIQIRVQPYGSPLFAIKIVNAIGNKLTSLTVSNFSNVIGSDENLGSLVASIARECVKLERFEFLGRHANKLLPMYKPLGKTLLELKITVLTSVNWHETLRKLQRNCRMLRSVHLDSGIMTSNSYLPRADALVDLLISFGSQLESASLTCVRLEHIPLVLSTCPKVSASVMYGERWENTASRFSHLGALGSRVCNLSMDGLEDAFVVLVPPAMASCNRIEDMCIEDVHTNAGVKALFSTKHKSLARIYLSLSNEKLEANTMICVANSTQNLRKLDLRLNHAGGTYPSALSKIAAANTGIEFFSLTEYGQRKLRVTIALVKSIIEFIDCAPNLKRVDVELIPWRDRMKWSDEIAALLLPYCKRKVSGCIAYNFRYEF